MKKYILLGIVFVVIFACFNHTLIASSLATGADQFVKAPEKYVQGKTIGVLCHRASVIGSGKNQIHLTDALAKIVKKKKLKCKVGALFAPEHGFDSARGAFDHIDHERSESLNCPIFSLHGEVKKPTPKMLEGLDLVVIDLQEVGLRCFTYISTMILALEAAAQSKVPVLILDRPNPIAQWGKAGKGVADDKKSFISKIDVPFLHGMTLGEIAQVANKTIGGQLQVISVRGNQRAVLKYFGKNFVPPSPNLANLRAVFCYPLTVCIEFTNYSEGRGTDAPFEQFGAPWVNGQIVAKKLNDQKLDGVVFEAVTFTPAEMPHASKPKHLGIACQGVRIKFSEKEVVKPLAVARAILVTLFSLYPQQSAWSQSFYMLNGTKTKTFGIDVLMAGDEWRLGVEQLAKVQEELMKKKSGKKSSSIMARIKNLEFFCKKVTDA